MAKPVSPLFVLHGFLIVYMARFSVPFFLSPQGFVQIQHMHDQSETTDMNANF